MTKPNNRNRTGGPQTNEGKSVASRNALKGGMYSATLVLPGESQADFEELKDTLMFELGAQGVLEASLVHEIAIMTWKKIRLQGLEYRCLLEGLSRPETPEEFYEAGFPSGEGSDWGLSNLALLTPEFLTLCRERLAQPKKSDEIYQKGWTRRLEAKEARKLEEELANQRAQELSKREGIPIHLARMMEDEKSWNPNELNDKEEKEREMLIIYFDESQRTSDKGALFVGDRLEEVQRIKEVIRDRRLTGFLDTNRFERAHDDLARGLSRALKELRSQQAWRRKNEVIDVTPNHKTD